MKNKNTFVFCILFFLITVITRVPFTSKYLFYADSVHFALAIKKYDVTVHQPHPPGYFLYVMAGRFLDIFFNNPNNSFIFLSIISSGLAVCLIFLLSKDLYNWKIATGSAFLSIFSPALWFHGEVALTYPLECFFSSLIALLCWRLLSGDMRYMYPLAFVMGMCGGFRQNTPVFLFPLWLYSMRNIPLKRILLLFMIFTVCSMTWFFSMVWMTGGIRSYIGALYDICRFNALPSSVFLKGYKAFRIYSYILLEFLILGIGFGFLFLCIGAYSWIRSRNFLSIDKIKALFFLLWITPSILFYMFIGIHPAVPGYTFIFLPCFFILTSLMIDQLVENLKVIFKKGKNLFTGFISLIVIVNTLFFLYYPSKVSYPWIKTHDKVLQLLINGMKEFDPEYNIILSFPYLFYGYRQVMYYLPEFYTYVVDSMVSPEGDKRKIFGGKKGETFLTEYIVIGKNINGFISPILSEHINNIRQINEIETKEIFPGVYIIHGSKEQIKHVYPELSGLIKFSDE